MPQYSFKALNPQGKTVKGETFAQNESDLESILANAKLDMIDCKAVTFKYKWRIKRLSDKDLIFLCIHFHELENAGVPLLDSVSDLRDSTESEGLRALMIDIYESLKNGDLLSQAFAKHAKIFDPLFIGLLSAGETTGNFAESFKQLEEHYKWILDLKQKVKRALIYPLTLMVVMIMIIVMMMIVVVPQLTSFLQSQNIDLPIYTRALIMTSDFFVHYWAHVAIVTTVIVIFFKFFGRISPKSLTFLDYIKINLPIFGGLIRKIEIARFCRFFAVTYNSGLNIIDSLEICQNVIGNTVIKSSIKYIQQSVSNGESLTKSLRSTGEFPSLVVRMFQIGEDGGNLDSTLRNINHFYDSEVNNTVSSLIAIIQPFLTILVGSILLWITVSIFGPIYGNFKF